MNISPTFRILVIDDNRAIHDDFRKILDPLASGIDHAEAEFFDEAPAPALDLPTFEIESAFQGDEGVTALRKALEQGRPYAMAFVDVRMPPGMDGIETVEALWELCPELQIVICTAYSDYSWQEMVDRLRYRDRLLVLKKPFAAVEALQIACALCEKWTLTQEAREHLARTEHVVEERTRELRESNERLIAEIKQREEAESQLRRAQRIESIGTLASGMAHDLNNMLAPILIAADLLRGQLVDESQDLISMIETSATRAAGVVKQVLTFARGADGESIPLQSGHLIREMKKIITETFPRHIHLQLHVADTLPLIQGDPTQLHQVLVNLCVNARDAMPDGGNLRIEANVLDVDEQYASGMPGARVGRYVRVRISDTGMGIQPHLLEKIFDPFFTTKPLGQGTGLGLSTVIGIVKSHEGFLDVTSQPGKGTTFEVCLPAIPDLDAANANKEPIPTRAGHGELILVVDDESAVRRATESVLTRHGYRTITAADGAEALSIFARQPRQIAAVFTDVMMPFVDGITLCRALQKLNPEVRIVAATGSGEEKSVQQLRLLNVSQVLAKPFTSATLLAAIDEALNPGEVRSAA
jgi:signal transduction histidine kinase